MNKLNRFSRYQPRDDNSSCCDNSSAIWFSLATRRKVPAGAPLCILSSDEHIVIQKLIFVDVQVLPAALNVPANSLSGNFPAGYAK
jgi:hypothetical protein